MNAVVAQPAFEYAIKILNGTEKGAKYRIASSQLTIGRSHENDVAIKSDSKISRKHIQITFNNHGIQAVDISGRKSMLINNELCEHAQLDNGTIIQIGDTKLQFIITTNVPAISPDGSPLAANKNAKKFKSAKVKTKRSPVFYILIIVVAGLLFLLLSGDNKKGKNKLQTINDQETINQKAERNKKLLEAYENQKKRYGKNSKYYIQAQASYLKGFREYEHGVYNRAIDEFQACLSLDPSHVLCKRYKNLAQRKFNELVQYKMILGRQYKDQNQFSACKKTYENIMFMIQDKTNSTYKEAKDNFIVCDTMLKGQF